VTAIQSKSRARGRPRSEARSAEILWAAAQLFAERGVERASTREIAARAGTTERTLFKHFGSKEALVRAVVEEAVLMHLAPLSLEGLRRAIGASAADLAGWHRSLLASRLQAWQGAPELVRLLMAEVLRDASARERFAAHWRSAAWKPLVSLFTSLQADRRLRSDIAPERMARLFLSLNLGYLSARLVLAPAADWDDEAELDAIVALFRSGSAAAP